MDKHFAFLLNCPKEGEIMMFFDYYENLKDHIDSIYEEVEISDEEKVKLEDRLKGSKYKVFKNKKND